MPARKRSKSETSYASYIVKVLKSKHPQLGISRNALRMANGIAEELAARLVVGSGKVAKSAKKSTLSCRHVQAATRVMLPFEMSKAAVSNGTVAVTKFAAA